MLALLATGLPAQWVGKDTLFRWPFGWLLRCLGGIPVNRREHTGFIEQLAAEFRHRSWMWLVLSPLGPGARPQPHELGPFRLALPPPAPAGGGLLSSPRGHAR